MKRYKLKVKMPVEPVVGIPIKKTEPKPEPIIEKDIAYNLGFNNNILTLYFTDGTEKKYKTTKIFNKAIEFMARKGR